MIKIQKVKTRSNQYELQVLAALSQFRDAESLDNVKSGLWEQMNNMKRQSVGRVTDFYKLLIETAKSDDDKPVEYLNLYHLNSLGDIDRLVCKVKIVNP